MKKIAFLFPGQGSQKIGMGRELYEEFDFVRDIFKTADKICGFSLTDLIFNGPLDEITKTVNLQPAITVINLACLAVLNKQGIYADISAGHSLGEYSALCSAGVITPQCALELVHQRGTLMHRESLKKPGAMTAIINLRIEHVEEIVNEASSWNLVEVANHNAEEQVVVSGDPETVNLAADITSTKGGRTIPLQVSGAWHCEYMRGAEDDFKTVLAQAELQTPQTPVLHNVTAGEASDPDVIRSLLVQQLCKRVRWYETMLALFRHEVNVFVEVGPGRVLSQLLKKSLPCDYDCNIFNVNNLLSFKKLKTKLM